MAHVHGPGPQARRRRARHRDLALLPAAVAPLPDRDPARASRHHGDGGAARRRRALGGRGRIERARARARGGGGPTLIEAITYRLADHTTSDDATRYRSSDEVEAARKLEPLVRMRLFLESRGLWNAEAEKQLRSECSDAVEEAVKEYLATPRQSADSMFDHLYAQLPKGLQWQREQARRFAHKR